MVCTLWALFESLRLFAVSNLLLLLGEDEVLRMGKKRAHPPLPIAGVALTRAQLPLSSPFPSPSLSPFHSLSHTPPSLSPLIWGFVMSQLPGCR